VAAASSVIKWRRRQSAYSGFILDNVAAAKPSSEKNSRRCLVCYSVVYAETRNGGHGGNKSKRHQAYAGIKGMSLRWQTWQRAKNLRRK